MEKILTISVPAYNISQYIDKLMGSLLECKNRDLLEILIVNDGSTDNTKELALEYQSKYSEFVKLVDKKNGGHGSTINAGIKHATGKYFKAIDGDDWVDPKQLDSLLEKLPSIEDDMLVCDYTKVDNDGNPMPTNNSIPNGFKYNKTYQIDDVCSSGTRPFPFHRNYYKTEVYKKSKELDEHCFYVDHEYNFFPLAHVKTVRFMNENIYMYRLGREGQSVSMEGRFKHKQDFARVVFSLSEFCSSENLSDAKKNYIKIKLFDLYHATTQLYYYLNDKNSARRYYLAIEQKMKKSYPDIYAEAGRRCKLIKITRLLSYGCYGLISSYMLKNLK